MNNIESLQKIFPSLKEDSAMEELEKITGEHPYFSAAQLYFLHKSKNNLSFSEKQSAKSALFFNNINWLKWQLNSYNEVSGSFEKQTFETEREEEKEEEIIEENIVETPEEIPVFKPTINFNTDVKEDTIAFEPLHTTDYFLSQGIKLSDEPISSDKLGTQMKSFTDWLKSMKKLHAQKPAATDDQTDRKIQTIAEDSNASTNVVTEAMADVLVKQDKIEKAIEMYTQLSLINPHKSAYFAAKIKTLSASGKI